MNKAPQLVLVGAGSLFLDMAARIFEEEGLAVALLSSAERFSGLGPGTRGIAFVDAGLLGTKPVDATRELCRIFCGLTLILVCDVLKTSNKEMAAMLLAGADDIFPYGLEKDLLLAKTKAHLRRLPFCVPAGKLSSRDGEIELCRRRRIISLRRSGRRADVCSLTPREFDLLALLLERQEQAMTRVDILEHIWEEKAEDMNSETVDRHVESLRKKLGAWGGKIKTLYGVGYVLKNESPPQNSRKKGPAPWKKITSSGEDPGERGPE